VNHIRKRKEKTTRKNEAAAYCVCLLYFPSLSQITQPPTATYIQPAHHLRALNSFFDWFSRNTMLMQQQ
jgi:hypothetical protein